MMARSTTRSKQRPDTLMQDRISQVDEILLQRTAGPYNGVKSSGSYDDATLWLLHHLVQKYGWDWMDQYMANKPNFIQGHLGQQRSVATGKTWSRSTRSSTSLS